MSSYIVVWLSSTYSIRKPNKQKNNQIHPHTPDAVISKKIAECSNHNQTNEFMESYKSNLN